MNIAFRTDASRRLGLGHLERCLALADALAKEGAACRFLLRETPAALAARVEKRGHTVSRLPAEPVASGLSGAPAEPGYAARDAALVREILELAPADIVVVDHYGLGSHWEARVRERCSSLMAIDDLADRPHACDLLLDPSLGREGADYAPWVPPGCALLLGPTYALLRREFAEARQRRAESGLLRDSLRRILVNFGGSDPAGITRRTLQGLDWNCIHSEGIRVDVVLGPGAGDLPWLQAWAQREPLLEVAVDVGDMAERMAAADFALGAPGGSAWERLCMGLPSGIVALAPNQSFNFDQLVSRNLALEWAPDAASRLPDGGSLGRASLLALLTTDGLGAQRVAAAMMRGAGVEDTSLCPAAAADGGFLLDLQQIPGMRRYFRDPRPPEAAEHRRWLSTTLQSDDHALWLIRGGGGQRLGVLRLDHLQAEAPELSILLHPDARGQGRGAAALRLATSALGTRAVVARVHRDNHPSRRLFRACGFREVVSEGPFLLYRFNHQTASDGARRMEACAYS